MGRASRRIFVGLIAGDTLSGAFTTTPVLRRGGLEILVPAAIGGTSDVDALLGRLAPVTAPVLACPTVTLADSVCFHIELLTPPSYPIYQPRQCESQEILS